MRFADPRPTYVYLFAQLPHVVEPRVGKDQTKTKVEDGHLYNFLRRYARSAQALLPSELQGIRARLPSPSLLSRFTEHASLLTEAESCSVPRAAPRSRARNGGRASQHAPGDVDSKDIRIGRSLG
ncbi:hypothetical protein R3P38DRAFT_1034640 [Favolaschia claudopus]|uniref:Uncharacterized protein n=1 Tax=Favolaschia claudopus TaxID=2862362 RepID=A0AAW0BIX5_9AGAR